MLLFTRPYARPAQDRILSRHAAELVVAHHPPQQAVVARRHLRMLVDGDGGQDRDIELEFLRVGNLRRKGRIQAVDAFHDQHVVVRQLEVLSFELACARGKVVFRNLDALAGEELLELLVQERDIQRLQALEVVISILVERRVDPVAEIVVERDDDGVQAVDPHVERQPLRGSGLSAARGTGDQHDPHPFAGCNQVGRFGIPVVVQGLRQIDQITGFAAGDGFIEGTDVVFAENGPPHRHLFDHSNAFK